MKIIQVCSHGGKLYAVDVEGYLYVRCSSLVMEIVTGEFIIKRKEMEIVIMDENLEIAKKLSILKE